MHHLNCSSPSTLERRARPKLEQGGLIPQGSKGAPQILLARACKTADALGVRNKSTALFCSALLLAAATHGSAALVASGPSSTDPQTAEIEKAQETVDLKISGMT